MDEGYSQDQSWDDEAEEDSDDKFRPEALKEKLIFLIDAQEEMFEEIVVFGQPSTSFDMARLTVSDLLRLKAWQHPDDQLAVILYNTREKDKPTGAAEDGGGGGGGTSLVSFEGVYTLLDLQRPSAEAVKAVRDFGADRFRAEVGCLPGGGRRDTCLADALWRAQHCLGGSKSADKSLNTIVVFSNDPEPCGPASAPGFKAAVQQLRSRVEALQGYRTALRLFPLAAAARPWAPRGGLWPDLLRALPGPGEGEAEGEGGAVGDDLTMLRELAADAEAATQAQAGSTPGAQASAQQAVLNSLFDAFRRRLARKRTLMRLRWQLGDKAAISVRAYLLVSDAAKAAKKMTPFNPTTNQPLKAVTSYVSVSDGALLDRPTAGAQRVFELKTGNRARLPQVVAGAAEVAELAALTPNGLALLGFKPRSSLQLWHQTRSSYFLRPDERAAPGSTAAFIALWRAMLSQDRIAVCRLKRGAAAPRLVALVAQDEQLSEYGVQSEAPGMYLIHLPFADDIRHPEAVVGLPNPTLDEAQVGAAAALLQALSLAGDGGGGGGGGGQEGGGGVLFDPGQVQNPWLQRHYTVVESLALSEPIPEWDPLRDDGTLPRRELWESGQAAAAVQAFREAFPQQGTKRKPAAAARAAKAEAAADAYDAVDWSGLLRSGGLKKLKIDELKTYLRKHQLKLTGKKDELLDRVTGHLQQQQ